MRRAARWFVVISAATIAAVAVILSFPSQLPPPKLTRPFLPIPAQPLRTKIECVGGLDISVIDLGRDWSVIQDHPPCAVGGVVLVPVKATAAEMSGITQRPIVTFKLSTSGLATDGAIIRSSGSKTLDERALAQVMMSRYPRQNCGLCRLSTPVNIGFQGPVWFRDTGLVR